MIENTYLMNIKEIENCIYTIRGVQVMLDSHLADMYGVDNKRLNEQVKRNISRFPESFRFQLTAQENENLGLQFFPLKREDSLRSQIATLDIKRGKYRKYLPYAFTEQGVAMLSAVLRSETAVNISIQIMSAFVEMRKLLLNNASLFQRLDKIEYKQLDTDEKFERIFLALENKDSSPDKGIFYNGQVFDSYTFVADLIRNAQKSIILIDNYIDDKLLTLFSKRAKGVTLTIYTKAINKQLALDVEKFNAQYEPMILKVLNDTHDRFLILDEKELYHIGASLKDLGKKWFAFSKMDTEVLSLLNKLEELK